MLLEEIQLITETYDNLFINDKEKRQVFGQQIFDMLNKAYKSLGGIKGNGFESVENMISKIPIWKLYRRGNDIRAVILYKDKSGRKAVAMATDGSKDGAKHLAQMIKDEYNDKRAYIEVSGPLLSFYKKVLGDELDNITIPSKKAAELLKLDDKDINIINDKEYERKLKGHWIAKRLVGYPGNKITQ